MSNSSGFKQEDFEVEKELNQMFIEAMREKNSQLQDLFNGEGVYVTLLGERQAATVEELNLSDTYCIHARPKGYEIYVILDQMVEKVLVQILVEEDILNFVEFYLQELGFQEVETEMYWQLFRK